jgi:hypothetical protein
LHKKCSKKCFPYKKKKRWSRYQHGLSCQNKKPKPKIGVVAGKGAMKDQDYGWLGKGRAVAQDLLISDPTNANTKIHNGSSPKEPIANVRAI